MYTTSRVRPLPVADSSSSRSSYTLAYSTTSPFESIPRRFESRTSVRESAPGCMESRPSTNVAPGSAVRLSSNAGVEPSPTTEYTSPVTYM